MIYYENYENLKKVFEITVKKQVFCFIEDMCHFCGPHFYIKLVPMFLDI